MAGGGQSQNFGEKEISSSQSTTVCSYRRSFRNASNCWICEFCLCENDIICLIATLCGFSCDSFFSTRLRTTRKSCFSAQLSEIHRAIDSRMFLEVVGHECKHCRSLLHQALEFNVCWISFLSRNLHRFLVSDVGQGF